MSQLSKNTVKGSAQLKDSEYVSFLNDYKESNVKVLFVGNSITLHGVLPEIGWNHRFGMAASSIENDYVHLCMAEIQKKIRNSSFAICQVCEWESNYKNGTGKFYLYENARNFNADIIIMRAVENCPVKDFDAEIFKKEYDKLLSFLNPSGNAKIIITTSFWKHPADDIIAEYAKDNKYALCKLGDLGELDEMKALGKFEHDGVAVTSSHFSARVFFRLLAITHAAAMAGAAATIIIRKISAI